MDPPIEDSIVRIREDCWRLGSLYLCERVNETADNAILHWQAGEYLYCIRSIRPSSADGGRPGDSEHDRVHQAGTSAAVWNIRGTFIKVKAWRSDMQLESETIQYVNSKSSVPTPKLLGSWIDAAWNRTFLVLEASKGQTLNRAWPLFSPAQRVRVASMVAQHCRTLALLTSETLRTANGKGVLEPFLTAFPNDLEPSWRPQMLGPYSFEQLQSYLSKHLVLRDPIIFHFQHADLSPGNIVVEERDGEIIAITILDWESAGFYPKFWLRTKVLVSSGFSLNGSPKQAWAILFAECLEAEGFSLDMDCYYIWRKAIGK